MLFTGELLNGEFKTGRGPEPHLLFPLMEKVGKKIK
jgi:hypothetical protein